MISVEEALARVLKGVSPLASEWISVREGLGRVLAAPVISRRTSPPFDQSSMDGYAVRFADVARAGAELEVIGEAAAGHAASVAVAAGAALRIFTGARLPAGADAIVIQEDVEKIGERRIRVRVPAARGAYVRTQGMDVREGQTIFDPGLQLAPRHLAIIAGVDCPWVQVYRRPRVAILATGDELARPGDPIGVEQIVAASTYGLKAYVERWGGEAIDLGIARDDRESLLAAARGAVGVDLLITTGGASVGDRDLVRTVLGESGGLAVDFWKIAMRPGKPLIFGHLKSTPFLGLPGNPVSSLVCAHLFLRPAIDKMRGLESTPSRVVRAELAIDMAQNDQRQDYVRARIDRREGGASLATPFEVQDSAMLYTYARADGLIIRAPNAPAIARGAQVDVLMLD